MPPYGEQHRKSYSQSQSPLLQALGRLMNPVPSLMEGLRKALVKKTCHLEEKKYLQYEIIDKFTEEDGSTSLYVIRESVYPGPSAWPIPHDAPYKTHLDQWIMAVLEAGLYNKWVADLLTETKLASQKRQRQRQAAGEEDRAAEAGDDQGVPVLTISHTQGAFMLLLMGLFLASLVSSRELLSKI